MSDSESSSYDDGMFDVGVQTKPQKPRKTQRRSATTTITTTTTITAAPRVAKAGKLPQLQGSSSCGTLPTVQPQQQPRRNIRKQPSITQPQTAPNGDLRRGSGSLTRLPTTDSLPSSTSSPKRASSAAGMLARPHSASSSSSSSFSEVSPTTSPAWGTPKYPEKEKDTLPTIEMRGANIAEKVKEEKAVVAVSKQKSGGGLQKNPAATATVCSLLTQISKTEAEGVQEAVRIQMQKEDDADEDAAEAAGVQGAESPKQLRPLSMKARREAGSVASASLKGLDEESRHLSRAAKYVVLAHTAYTVFTGAEFWNQIASIRERHSTASVLDVCKRFQRSIAASKTVLSNTLHRVEACVGSPFEVVACTELPKQQESIAQLVALEELRQKGGGGTPAEALRAKELLDRLAAPDMLPGWVLARSEGNLYISIAGSQNADDCFRDGIFVPRDLEIPLPSGSIRRKYAEIVKGKKVKVHSGFLEAAMRLFEQIRHKVQEELSSYPSCSDTEESGASSPKAKRLKLHFTGHSIGGGLALILSVFFAAWKGTQFAVGGVTLFGAPNVFFCESDAGLNDLVRLVAASSPHGYVNNRDIVPRALGCTHIAKLAKPLIKCGVSSLSQISANHSSCLQRYRSAISSLYWINSEGLVSHIAEDSPEYEPLLQVGVADCRPEVADQHHITVYVARILAALRTATKGAHPWGKDNQNALLAVSEGKAHPMAEIVFSKKDPCALAPAFRGTVDRVFRILHRNNGEVSRRTFGAFLRLTNKPWPSHLLQKCFDKGGAYEVVENAAGNSLTAHGFARIMEEMCYADLPWVARVVSLLGSEGSDELIADKIAEEAAENVHPAGVPLLTGDRGTLHPNVRSTVTSIFSMYKAPDGTLPLSCLEGFVSRVENMGLEVPVVLSPGQLSALTKTLVSEVFPEARSGTPFILAEKDFAALFREWCGDHELHVWRILHEFDASLETGELTKPVVNVHVSGDCESCNRAFALEESKRSAEERMLSRQTRHDALLTEKIQALIQKKRLRTDHSKMDAANAKLEAEVIALKRRLHDLEKRGGHGAPPLQAINGGEMRPALRVGSDARSQRLLTENKQLRRRVAEAPSATEGPLLVQKMEQQLEKKTQELLLEKRRNKELTTLSRRCGTKALTIGEKEAKVSKAANSNETVLAGLRQRVKRSIEETIVLQRTETQQNAELEQLPKELPKLNLQDSKDVLIAWDQMVWIVHFLKSGLRATLYRIRPRRGDC